MTVSRVLLLHSNDIHSRLEQASRLSAYVRRERRTVGSDRLLLLDVGDHMDRMRPETEGTGGLVNVALLNEAGYDAVTLGNNEGLTYTAEDLDAAYGRGAEFQVVCANMARANDGSRPAWMRPAATIERGGVTFGIIGVTAAYRDFYGQLGWEMSDPIATAAEFARRLRPQVDVVVLLSHLGLAHDRRIAEEIEGIDLILGGHTHHLLEEPLVINGTTVCAAGKFGDHIGRVEVVTAGPGRKPTFRASVEALAGEPESRTAGAIIDGCRERADAVLSRVVCRLSEPLDAGVERESPLANLLAAGLRRHAGAEIGLVNTGQLLGGLAAGRVTAGRLHAICPSPINPCRMRLAGRHIRQALEEALLDGWIRRAIRGFGFRGERLGTLAVDGLEVTYDPARPPLSKIIEATAAGKPLRDDAEYVVGTIDMFTFGCGYESIRCGTDIRYYLPEFIRDVLAHELADGSSLRDAARARWRAVRE